MKKVLVISIVVGISLFLYQKSMKDDGVSMINESQVKQFELIDTKHEQRVKSQVAQDRVVRIKPEPASFASNLDQLLQGSWDTESLMDFLTDHEEELDDPVVLDLLVNKADRFDDELVIDILDLIVDFEQPEVLDFANQAFESSDEEVRVAVMDALDLSELMGIEALIIKGLNDESEDVRDAALYAAMDKDESVVMEIVSGSLRDEKIHNRSDILDLLDDHSTHQSIELLFRELSFKNKDYKEAVNEKIFFFIGEEFETSEQALMWWKSNKKNYDTDLHEID